MRILRAAAVLAVAYLVGGLATYVGLVNVARADLPAAELRLDVIAKASALWPATLVLAEGH